jgi:hypothetical protein
MSDWMEELERLAELRDKGLLSDAEFEKKKTHLLSSKQEPSVQQVETTLKWAPIKQKYLNRFKWAFGIYILLFGVAFVFIVIFVFRGFSL